MKNSKYKIISNKSIQRQKFFIAFACFLFALLVVVAIFYLATKKNEIKWLEGNSGLAREKLFPLVYISDNDIYVLEENGKISEIDNDTINQIYDTTLDRVYYVYNGTNELYEYFIGSGKRVKLCSYVKKFYLFEERTIIPFVTPGGEINVYSYKSDSSFKIRNSSSKLPEEYQEPVVGKDLLVYFDNFDSETNTATLMCLGSDGSNYPIDEKVMVDSNIVILKDDAGVSYYTEEGLVITSLPNLVSETFPNSYEISSTYRVLATKKNYVPKPFDSCFNMKYVVTTGDAEYSSLSYFSITKKKINVSVLSSNVSEVIGYSEDAEMLLYTSVDEDGIGVYLSTNGGEPKLITTCEKDTSFNFDPDAYKLYMISKDGTVSLLDVNERVKKQFVVAEKATSVFSYYGKKFAIATNEAENQETLIFSQYLQVQTYKNEKRLYGALDDTYLLKRTYEDNSGMSLDLVEGDKYTRICGDVEDTIVFDKKLENIVYQSKGVLYLYSNGVSTKLTELTDVFEPVYMVANK